MKFLSKQMTTKCTVFSDKLEIHLNALRAKLIAKFGNSSISSNLKSLNVNSQLDDHNGNQPNVIDDNQQNLSSNSQQIATDRPQLAILVVVSRALLTIVSRVTR